MIKSDGFINFRITMPECIEFLEVEEHIPAQFACLTPSKLRICSAVTFQNRPALVGFNLNLDPG